MCRFKAGPGPVHDCLEMTTHPDDQAEAHFFDNSVRKGLKSVTNRLFYDMIIWKVFLIICCNNFKIKGVYDGQYQDYE